MKTETLCDLHLCQDLVYSKRLLHTSGVDVEWIVISIARCIVVLGQ